MIFFNQLFSQADHFITFLLNMRHPKNNESGKIL